MWTRGQQIARGKYNIRQKLGEGGFGVTYRARDNRGRQVVIKTLNETLRQHPDFAKFQEDFMNEALRLARCSHPHIVRVYEVIQESGLWCMVMEYRDRHVVRGAPDPLVASKQINPNISDRLNQAILEGMQIYPENRPQSMADWLALLRGRISYPNSVSSSGQTNSVSSSHQSSLTSAVGMDYKRLHGLLVAEEWKLADQETAVIIQKIASRQKEGWLRAEDINNFPGEDLRTINQLEYL